MVALVRVNIARDHDGAVHLVQLAVDGFRAGCEVHELLFLYPLLKVCYLPFKEPLLTLKDYDSAF